MADFEVHLDLHGHTRPIGLVRGNRVRGAETIMFEYDRGWLEDPDRFSLEPALALTRGAFAPPAGLANFGSIGDTAPDTWGRRLMQRSERRSAGRKDCPKIDVWKIPIIQDARNLTSLKLGSEQPV